MKVVLGLSRGSGSVMGRNWNCVDQVVKSFPSSTLAGQSWGIYDIILVSCYQRCPLAHITD